MVQNAVQMATTAPQVSKNDRVNAMAAANTAWQAYQGLESAKDFLKAPKANAAEVSATITYGEQRNRSENHQTRTEAQSSQVLSGGKTYLIATGAGQDSDINIIGSDVIGKGGTYLSADDQINLQSAIQTARERSSNKSSGWNAGVAASYGQNGMAFGVTAGGNYGKGYGKGDGTTHRHSQLGDRNSQTTLQSGGTTTLKGARVHGKGIDLSVQDLLIESVQDTATYQSKQQNINGQVTVGYGASVSAGYDQSKINADHASVSQQSGLFAGDDGYRVNVTNHTELKGGVIASSQQAENEGKNHFSTHTLAHSDIENHSRYEGESFGLGGNFGFNGKGSQELGNTGIKLAAQGAQSNGVPTAEGKQGATASKSIGYGNDGDSQSSITKSGINTQNIQIKQDSTGELAQSVYTDITRETAQQLSGSLKNVFDKEAVQSELDLQVQVTQAFDQNRQAAKAEINKAHDTAKAQLDAGEITQAEYDAKVAQLNGIGFVLDSVASGLSTPSNSVSGSLIATASPLVTQKVGELFKTGGALYEYEGTVLHGVAQGVVAAAVAAAGDNNALSAGLAAGSAEVLAPKVSQFLYGTSDADKLTSEQKQTVSAILGMAGSALGATVGNSGADVVVSGGLAQNAVENNGLKEDALKKLGDVRKYLDAKSREALDGLIDAYKKGDIELAKKYKSQLDDAIEAWATSGGYEVLGVNPKAAVGAMVYATGELLIPTNVTELVPVGKLSKATKALKLSDNVLTKAPQVAIFEKIRTVRSDRYANLTDVQLYNKIEYVMSGQKISVNSGKTIYLSPDKKDILIIDPLNPMGGTIFPNTRDAKRTTKYINKFIEDEGGIKW